MPTVRVFPVAVTTAGTPRTSPTINYSGNHAQSVMLQIVSPTWGTDDPAITVSLEIQQSFDGGATWAQFCATTTGPQRFSRTGALPNLNCYAGDNLGARQVRAVLSIDTGTLTLGVDATT